MTASFLVFVCGFWVFDRVSMTRDLRDAEEQLLVLKERLVAKVPLSEYKTVVTSLDLCNERLYDLAENAYSNDYVIQQNMLLEKFDPDDLGSHAVLCNECAANCEQQLDWCYFYRYEACECADDWEMGL